MEIKELEHKYFFHDESLVDVEFDNENKVLELKLEFCEWQIEELEEQNISLKGCILKFKNVKQFLAYSNIETIIKDENWVEFINIKENKKDKSFKITLGLEHCTPQTEDLDRWFFIEFISDGVDAIDF